MGSFTQKSVRVKGRPGQGEAGEPTEVERHGGREGTWEPPECEQGAGAGVVRTRFWHLYRRYVEDAAGSEYPLAGALLCTCVPAVDLGLLGGLPELSRVESWSQGCPPCPETL